MSSPTTPDDATDEDESATIIDTYDTLEEFIFQTERDKDNEIRKAVRVPKWQNNIYQKVSREIGTNKAEVHCRAYYMGLRVLVDEFGEDINDIDIMRTNFFPLLEDVVGDLEYIREVQNELYEYERSDPQTGEYKLENPENLPVKDSVYSEAKKMFKDRCGFDGWFNRFIAGVGLSHSEFSGKSTDMIVEDRINAVEEEIQDIRYNIEKLFTKYMDMNIKYWMNNGIDDEHIEMMEEIVSSMKTEHKREAADTLSVIEEVTK